MAKGYGCEAAGWEFKSELDLLLLMLCEDNKLIVVVRIKENCQHTPKQNKKKKNQTSTCNLGKPKKIQCKESSS